MSDSHLLDCLTMYPVRLLEDLYEAIALDVRDEAVWHRLRAELCASKAYVSLVLYF